MADTDLIKNMTVEIFDNASVAKQLATLTRKREVKPVYEHAALLGFSALEGRENLQGFKRTYNARDLVKEGNQSVQKLELSYQVQELQKRGSKDKAAIIITTMRGVGVEEGVDNDARLLIAPGGDINKTEEFKVDKETNKIVPTNSWWTRFKACIQGKCTNECLKALVSCPTTSWAAYLGCLALKCGGCSAKCVGCATCKCRWWCKWAVSCCK